MITCKFPFSLSYLYISKSRTHWTLSAFPNLTPSPLQVSRVEPSLLPSSPGRTKRTGVPLHLERSLRAGLLRGLLSLSGHPDSLYPPAMRKPSVYQVSQEGVGKSHAYLFKDGYRNNRYALHLSCSK